MNKKGSRFYCTVFIRCRTEVNGGQKHRYKTGIRHNIQKTRSSAFTIGITICFESRKIQQGRKAVDRMKNVDKVSGLHL